MPRADMLGPIVRVLTDVPQNKLKIFLDIANKISEKENGEAWRKLFAEVLEKGFYPVSPVSSKNYILPIDRSKSFDPVAFIGDGWKIETQDEHSLALDKVDFASVRFEHCLRVSEVSLTGVEKLKRHRLEGHILLDAKIGQTLFEEDSQKTLKYFHKEKGITRFELYGTIFLDRYDDRCVLYLYQSSGGRWSRGMEFLSRKRGVRDPALVLPKV